MKWHKGSPEVVKEYFNFDLDLPVTHLIMWPAFSIAFLCTFVIVLPTMVIRMRHTRAHTKNRRSHHGLKEATLATCSNCGSEHRPHHMCLQCGFYKGRQVIDLKTQKDKRDGRIQAKKDAIKAQSESVAPNESEAVAEAEIVESEQEKK